jgi:hypothetical protein
MQAPTGSHWPLGRSNPNERRASSYWLRPKSGDEVNAYLLDLVTNRLLDRSFGGDGLTEKR